MKIFQWYWEQDPPWADILKALQEGHGAQTITAVIEDDGNMHAIVVHGIDELAEAGEAQKYYDVLMKLKNEG